MPSQLNRLLDSACDAEEIFPIDDLEQYAEDIRAVEVEIDEPNRIMIGGDRIRTGMYLNRYSKRFGGAIGPRGRKP